MRVEKNVPSNELLTNLDDANAVRDASALCDAASEQRRSLEAELERLEEKLGGGGDGSEIMELAERALAGQSIATMAIDSVALVGKIADARRKLRIAEAAERMASERSDAARKAALAKLLPECTKAYAAIVDRMAQLLISLRAEVAREKAFRETYLDGHHNVKLFPGRIYPMCFPFDDYRVGHWIEEGIEHGLLGPSVMDEFRDLLPTRDWH